jgi:hypothetical protein
VREGYFTYSLFLGLLLRYYLGEGLLVELRSRYVSIHAFIEHSNIRS